MKQVSESMGRFYGTVTYALDKHPEIGKKMNNVIKYEIETPVKGGGSKQPDKIANKVPFIDLFPKKQNTYIDNYMADEFKKVSEEPVERKQKIQTQKHYLTIDMREKSEEGMQVIVGKTNTPADATFRMNADTFDALSNR